VDRWIAHGSKVCDALGGSSADAAHLRGQARYEADDYDIAVRQFEQQILPAGMPATTVWSYGSVTHRGTFNYPAFTIEARYQVPVRVRWINDLPGPYTGPVPIVTHLHGGHTKDHNDGYPEAWFLPAARNIPDGFATKGSRYDHFRGKSPFGGKWCPGHDPTQRLRRPSGLLPAARGSS